MKPTSFLTLFAAVITLVFAQVQISGVNIPQEFTYLLPEGYHGKASENFIDTQTSNSAINTLLAAARNASYYSYDSEFQAILGPSPTLRIIDTPKSANEAGVWVSDLNQVWFTGSQTYTILDLANYTVSSPGSKSSILSQGSPGLVGGDYFNGSVYFAAQGNKSAGISPGVYKIDPTTRESSMVLNSWYGISLNSIDDVSWTTCTNPSEPQLFMTSWDLSAENSTAQATAVLPNAVWRFSPSTKSLQAVISRADILVPNGLHADPSGRYLYVSDTTPTSFAGAGSLSSGSTAVFKFDLDEDCNPVNKRMFAMVRSGVADGIRVDNLGRVWTAESNGIVVRNSKGKELGVFNAEPLAAPTSPIKNFALAGDKLVIGDGKKIVVIQLGQNVTTPAGERFS